MRRSAVAAIAKAARELEGDERAKAVAEECVWPIREWRNRIRETVDDAIEVRARRPVAAVAAAGQAAPRRFRSADRRARAPRVHTPRRLRLRAGSTTIARLRRAAAEGRETSSGSPHASATAEGRVKLIGILLIV